MYALFIIWLGNAGRLIQYTIHIDLDVTLDNVCTFQIQRNIGSRSDQRPSYFLDKKITSFKGSLDQTLLCAKNFYSNEGTCPGDSGKSIIL